MKKDSKDMMRSLLNLKEDYTLDLTEDSDKDLLQVERVLSEEDADETDKETEDKTDKEKSDETTEEEADETENEAADETEEELADNQDEETPDEQDEEDPDNKAAKDGEEPVDNSKGDRNAASKNVTANPDVEKAYQALERAATPSDVAISLKDWCEGLQNAMTKALANS